jgi:hypothetical protein
MVLVNPAREVALDPGNFGVEAASDGLDICGNLRVGLVVGHGNGSATGARRCQKSDNSCYDKFTPSQSGARRGVLPGRFVPDAFARRGELECGEEVAAAGVRLAGQAAACRGLSPPLRNRVALGDRAAGRFSVS